MGASESVVQAILQLMHISVIVAALWTMEKIATRFWDEHCRPKKQGEQEERRQ